MRYAFHRLTLLGAAFRALAFTALIAYPPSGYGDEETDLKAAFVQRLCHFVSWPTSEGGDPDRPFVIAVVGPSDLDERLQTLLSGKRIRNRPFEVRSYERLARLAEADLVFVSEGYDRWTERIVARYEDEPTLTIGEYEDFALRGGAISLYVKHGKLALKLNHKAAERHGISFSPKLIAVSENVVDKP